MIRRLITHRRIIWLLGMRLARERYLDTLGGTLWAVLNPIALLAVYWYVFDVGLRIQEPTGKPFVLTLFAGLIPWMFFSECLIGATTAVTGRAFLVKKIAFPLEVLPFSHLVAALVTHVLMLAVFLVMLTAYGMWPGVGAFMVFYFFVFASVLVGGLGMLVAALNVFYRDVAQGIGIVVNIWFWATPIVWSRESVSSDLNWLINYNPVNYIVTGYRNALLTDQFVSLNVESAVMYWLFAIVLFVVGSWVFVRLKPSFADML